jgi:hypothetical protein
MLSLDACRSALGALADNKSDEEIARMREQASAVARIVIRTYFLAPPAGSICIAGPFDCARDPVVEQDDGIKEPKRPEGRRPHQGRRRPVSQVANSRAERRPRGEKTTRS